MTMESQSSFSFVESIRRACDLLARLVWESHKLGLERDQEWPEEHFFSALINQGFGRLDPRAKNAFQALEAAGTFRLSVQCGRHNPGAMEPLTGADLGVLATVTVNGKEVARRGFLVQLKKASVQAGKIPRASLERLHHLSGHSWWKQELHQAERMLKFTNAAVYWIAVPPGAEADQEFFKLYLESANFAARRRLGEVLSDDPARAYQAVLPEAWLLSGLGHPEFDFLLHRLERWTGVSSSKMASYFADSEADRLYRNLRLDAAAAARRLYGLRSLVPVMAIDAESILGLYQAGKRRALADLYPSCVSLSEFLLTHVIAHGFGDDDPDLMDALLKNRPNASIRAVAADLLREKLPENMPLARETMTISITAGTHG